MSQQDENNINYSNQAVYNSQSSIKDYSELKTPLNRLTHSFIQSQQFMLSDFKSVEDDPQFITPAKVEETQFNRDVTKCYAPRKENPDKAHDYVFKRIKGQQQQQQYFAQMWGAQRQYFENFKGF